MPPKRLYFGICLPISAESIADAVVCLRYSDLGRSVGCMYLKHFSAIDTVAFEYASQANVSDSLAKETQPSDIRICITEKGNTMSERRVDPTKLLPEKPFLYGMASAFDLFGVSARRMHSRIEKQWRSVMDQPRKSAEETIQDDLVRVNSQYQELLAEHNE